jgi:hypothetical protein
MKNAAKARHAPAGGGEFYAVLEFDEARVLLPQREIHILELTADMKVSPQASGALGWIDSGDQRCPVYGLNGDLAILHEVPENRRVCALMDNAGSLFGLLCEKVDSVAGHRITRHPVPLCMHVPASPIESLAVLGQGLGLVSSAALLADHLLLDE